MAKKFDRTLKLLCLTNPHVYEVGDDGCVYREYAGPLDRQGRAQLKAMLAKRIGDDGGARMPQFVLADPPAVAFEPNDPFLEALTSRDTGAFLKPSEAWLAERERRCAKLEQRKASARELVNDSRAREVLRGLAPLLGLSDDTKAGKKAQAPK